MATYRITSPGGQEFEVSAPDTATQDQVLEYAKSQWKKGVAAPAAKAEMEDPGFAQSVLIGTGRTVDRVSKGMQQLYYGLRGDDKELASLKQQAADDDAAYKPLQDARPWATQIGESLPSAIIPAGGAATLWGNAGRMAAAGALQGVLEYGSLGDRAWRGSVGAASGASVPVIGAGLKTATSFAEPLFNAGREKIVGRTLNRVAGADAKAVISKLKAAQQLVPGSVPTAAQVAENGGIAAMERAAAGANPDAYTRRAMEQSSARLNALRGIAGDDAAMTAAKSAREAASDALYKQADAGLAPIDGAFKGLQMRPQFKSAIERARELAKNNGLDDIFFKDAEGKPIALLGEGAHLIKKALDEMGEYGSNSYSGKAGAEAASRTNEAFQSWLEQSIPEYGAAKATFAQHSIPINRMEIGQALLNKAQPALSDFGALGRESGATYANAMRNADAVAAKAIGFPGARMEDVLSPGQMSAVTGVAQDLARKANAQDLGRGVGSDTFQKLSMQNIAGQSGMAPFTRGLLELPAVSRATAWVYRDADQKMQDMLSDALLNPKKAAELMERANKKWLADNPNTRRLLEQAAVRSGGLLGLTSSKSYAEPTK